MLFLGVIMTKYLFILPKVSVPVSDTSYTGNQFGLQYTREGKKTHCLNTVNHFFFGRLLYIISEKRKCKICKLD